MVRIDQNQQGFFARFKQHHLYRVVVVYAIFAWVLIQLSNSVFTDFGLSQSAVRVLIVILLLGFPVVVAVAWMLIKPRDPAKLDRWQRLHWKLGAVLSAAMLVLVVISAWSTWRYSEQHPLKIVASPPGAPAFQPSAGTLVVLPFTNLNGDPKLRYFSDGITQDLTDALGENPALRVIAWDTASAYRDTQQNATTIGKALNVANLLYGSILRQGNRVRVTVELVNTVSGYQLWSDHYDEQLKDIFSVQDGISGAIASALGVQLAVAPVGRSINPQAYDFYLRGRTAADLYSTADLKAAEQYFKQALALDPDYADAWGRLAHVYIVLNQVSNLPHKTAFKLAAAATHKALALDPNSVQALTALGNIYADTHHLSEARAAYQHALALDPSDATAHMDYALILPYMQALAQDQVAVQLNPRSVIAQNNLAADYVNHHDYLQALVPILAMLQLTPDNIDAAFSLAFVNQQLRHYPEMVSAFDLVRPTTALDKQLAAAGKLTYKSLLDPALRAQAMDTLAHLPVAKLSPNQQYDLIQLQLALGQEHAALRLLTSLCAAAPEDCTDLAINPNFQVLHGNRSFEKIARRYTTTTLN